LDALEMDKGAVVMLSKHHNSTFIMERDSYIERHQLNGAAEASTRKDVTSTV
jgi:hypothetical protein